MEKTAYNLWKKTVKRLKKIYSQKESESIASILITNLLEISVTDIWVGKKVEIDEQRIELLVSRLLDHEPIQYVVGHADFYGKKYSVNSDVFIPRPETEELVRWIIERNQTDHPHIVEVGVGSGCISIALQLATGAKIIGTDISQKALHVAKNNAASFHAKIDFFCHDVLKTPIPGRNLDILVSNPPYVLFDERHKMAKNVVAYEPHQALFVPTNKPLIFYEKIMLAGLQNLKLNGKLYFEVHEKYAKKIAARIIKMGYGKVVIKKDMQEKDRFITAVKII